MKLLRQIVTVVRIESHYFARHPRMLVSAFVALFVPALYAFIYLSSIWDPAAHTGALPVGLVNLDAGVTYREHRFNVGADVVASLVREARFGYREFASEDEARQRVRTGELAFALILPFDFSSNAVPGNQPGAGKPVVFASEGNNYESASMARHFAETLGHKVNERLNEQRWALVLNETIGSQRGVERLRQAAIQLQAGAHQLHEGVRAAERGAAALAAGSASLGQGVTQLTDGFRQLGGGLRSLESQRPPNAEMNRLKNGADALANGHQELARGLDEMREGTQRLLAGVQGFQAQLDNAFVPDGVSAGVTQLTEGLTRLDASLLTAHGASRRLGEGASALGAGVNTLNGSMRGSYATLHGAVAKLPEDGDLDQLEQGAAVLAARMRALHVGTRELAQGAQSLAGGFDQLLAALPRSLKAPDGSPQGLASSVEPKIELDTQVRNSGAGFSPNVIAGALWLGVSLVIFLLHVRVLPEEAQGLARPVQVAGKLALPGIVVTLQTLCVALCVMFVLKIPIARFSPFLLTLSLAALTFLLIVFALALAFGDAGKGLAMILLAVQMTSSGGILPVELSGGLFADISPWLPLTWVVKGLKAAMFGAYGGEWLRPLGYVVIAGLCAALLACLRGRWRFVHPATVRPTVEF